MKVTTEGVKINNKECSIAFWFDPEDYSRLLEHGIKPASTLIVNPPLQAYEVVKQPLQHTLEYAELLTKIGNAAVEWADDFLSDNDPCTMEALRSAAYSEACQMFDGEDATILKAGNPTEYEHEVLITTYVISAIQYAQQHTVIR
jgi:hypothetical protein